VSGGSNNLTYDVLVDSRMKWNDEQQDIALLTVHSVVFKNMMKLKDSTGRPLLIMPQDASTELARFNGIPVLVSDRNTVTTGPTKYRSKVIKKGALAFWYSKEPVVDTDKDILTDSVVAAAHVYWVAYRYARTPGATQRASSRS
jgi:HK97 family phage major capsid protein